MLRAMWVTMAVVMACSAQAQTPREQLGAEAGTLALNDPLKGTFRATQTTADDQTDVAVTVYNNNLALVRDRRKVVLFPGEISLTFMDVAQQIRPETVSLRSVSDPGAIRIIEQNYEYDLMSPAKLMEKYVGKRVRLVNFSTEIGFTEVEGVLLSNNQGPIYQVGDEIFLGHPGTVVLPEIPENLISKPSLVWLLDNEGTDQEIEITYLTGGISWKADYVLRMSKDETQMDLDAWVTLNNGSGAAYINAQLKLVAGDVNIARPEVKLGRAMMAVRGAPVQEMREEAFAEYHLYTLPRRTTIKENQSKQVSLFKADEVGVTKEYEYRGSGHYFSQRVQPMGEEHVNVFLKFLNEEENNLGVPLPAGIMRVYQEDSEGMLQFAGEDRIGHTPKDEEVRLRMGSAFDVIGERKQMDFRRISDRVFESAYEIRVRNHKETAIVVDVIEPMSSDWEILESSHEFEKRDAQTAVFPLAVASDGEVVLTYRVRVRY